MVFVDQAGAVSSSVSEGYPRSELQEDVLRRQPQRRSGVRSQRPYRRTTGHLPFRCDQTDAAEMTQGSKRRRSKTCHRCRKKGGAIGTPPDKTLILLRCRSDSSQNPCVKAGRVGATYRAIEWLVIRALHIAEGDRRLFSKVSNRVAVINPLETGNFRRKGFRPRRGKPAV